MNLKGIKDSEYRIPPLNLLNEYDQCKEVSEEARAIADNIELTMAFYGAPVKVVGINEGPASTVFEIIPELGVRINTIKKHVEDLRINLGKKDLRIYAPIPGKSAIGIELTKDHPDNTSLKELLESLEMRLCDSCSAFPVGKASDGTTVIIDLDKAQHLLIGGATGSGKSVFLSTIIMSIVFRTRPSEIGLILIDTVKQEFRMFSDIPHLIMNNAITPTSAINSLRWVMAEITDRYQRMQCLCVRDYHEYNNKYDKGIITIEESNPRRMYQILIIIDEFADLMMTVPKEAEELTCRIAQLGRAVGVHLVISTQNPSSKILTGMVRANITSRIAFKVANGIDSRNIIGGTGAETLLGNGDMLYSPTGSASTIRLQGAYVSDEEICAVNHFFKDSTKYRNTINKPYTNEEKTMDSYVSNKEGYDELFYEAGITVIKAGKGSSSLLQRVLSIDFFKAAKLIDQLFECNVVGPQNGAKPREVLVNEKAFKEMCKRKGIK